MEPRQRESRHKKYPDLCLLSFDLLPLSPLSQTQQVARGQRNSSEPAPQGTEQGREGQRADDSEPREPIAACWTCKRAEGSRHRGELMFGEPMKELSGDPEKQSKGLGQLILEWVTLNRKA